VPFRLSEFRAKVQFITFAQMPALIYKACLATGKVSNTQYIQHAVCEALARDLDIPLEDLIGQLPKPRGMAGVVLGPDRKPVPVPSRTVEEVR
jgi:hypothetical protein